MSEWLKELAWKACIGEILSWVRIPPPPIINGRGNYMKCPFCETQETKVTDSRYSDVSSSVRRRRACLLCEKRFTTFEAIALDIQVRKRDGRFEVFHIDKIICGISKACIHSQIHKEQINKLAREIQVDLLDNNIEVIDTLTLGEIVLRKLRVLDKMVYIRFASVYKRMQKTDELIREIKQIDPETILNRN